MFVFIVIRDLDLIAIVYVSAFKKDIANYMLLL